MHDIANRKEKGENAMPENLKLNYHRNHARRYAHIPEEQRKEYPDVIIIKRPKAEGGNIRINRKYTLEELREIAEHPREFDELSADTSYVINNFGTTIYAKDVPMTQVMENAKRRRQQVARVMGVAVASS